MSSYIGWRIVDDSADDGTLLVESPQGHRRRVLFEATMADHIGGTNEKVECNAKLAAAEALLREAVENVTTVGLNGMHTSVLPSWLKRAKEVCGDN